MVAEQPDSGRTGLAGSARRRGREVALQVLYAIDVASDRRRARAAGSAEVRDRPPAESAADAQARDVFDVVSAHFEMPGAARDFARELTVAVRQRVPEIDGVIAAHARNWRISRMATVDRNILRLAGYELAYTDTPTAVILNEAVDLARRFGGETSPGFVNGILDAMARDLRNRQEREAT